MTRYYHFDDFNGSGALGSYWADDGGSSWSQLSGNAILSTLNVDAQIVHQTDANIPLPLLHSVETAVAWETGVSRVGVVMLSGTDATVTTGRVRFSIVENAAAVKTYQLDVGGVNLVTVPVPASPPFTVDGTTFNSIRLAAVMQNATHYYFVASVNNFPVILQSPLVQVNWTPARQVGLVAKRESFGVANPSVKFSHIVTSTEENRTGHPQPTDAAAAVRTPLVIGDESRTGSPATFPFKVGITKIRHRRDANQFITDMGYTVSHPRWTGVRRIFECYWIGTEADFYTLQFFHRARVYEGTNQHFLITIHPLGIGSIKAAFLDASLSASIVASNVWRCEFTLVEVI